MNAEYAELSPSNPKYPETLKRILPNTKLYAIGNLDLLHRRAIGVCGSREASPEAQRCAFNFGREVAKYRLVVVSGYARGVDREAHRGALEAGGATIAVLPEGINYFRIVSELKNLVDPARNFLAISMFNPEAVWMSWRAMQRNKLIVGLSVGLLVIEARERGGTINAATECVRQRKILWAIAYSKEVPGREGSRKLLQESAIPLRHQSDLREALELASQPSEDLKQLALTL